MMRTPLAWLAALFDRIGRYEPAATIAGFAASPMTAAFIPEITTAIAHLRDVFGDPAYESLAGAGEKMAAAAWRPTHTTKSTRPEQNSHNVIKHRAP